MDKRQKKEWDKMTKQWDEIRGLARAAGERDDRAKAAAARVREEQLARMAALRKEAPRNEAPRSSNPMPKVPTERSPQHPPEGETPPLCWCRDPCKFFKSKHPLSLGMRYWGCANYSSDYPDRRWDTSSYRQPSPDPLCGYHKWIDLEIHPYDQWTLDFEEWNVTRSREIRDEERRNDEKNERIRRETIAHLEACNRRQREAREREREKKREIAAEAQAASEEYNADLARKGKWPRSTQ